MKHLRYTFLCAILTLVFFSGHAQEKPIKLKDINKDNLKMKYYPKDSSANALILCDYGHTYFRYYQDRGFRIIFERHVRKKIFNKNGYSHADFSIPLYQTSKRKENLSKIRGYTYNLKNGRESRTRLKKRNIYNEEKTENIEYAKFSMPEVREGSIIELKYTIESDFLYNISDWQFQHKIPVKWSGYIVEIPEYFHFNNHSYGHEPYAMTDQDIEWESFFITRKYKGTDGGIYSSSNNSGHYKQEIDYKTVVYKWVAKDLPAFEEEPYMTTASNYMNRVEFELSKITFPRRKTQYYAKSWESIKDELYKNRHFGKQINRPNTFLNEKVEVINNFTENLSVRMNIVYEYIKNTLHWNSEKDVTTDNSLRKVWKEKTGNSAEINLLLTAMLRKSGIDANPVILSTRDHGIIHPFHASLNQTNYVISCASIDGEDYFLDATEPYGKINMLPKRCLNGKGRLMSEQETKDVSLQTEIPYKVKNFAIIKLDDQKVQATIKSVKSDYAGYNFRKRYSSFNNEEEYIKNLEKDNNIEINSYSIENIDSLDKKVTVNLDSVIVKDYTQAGNRIYFNPVIYRKLTENPFKLDTRKYPVDYAYPYTYSSNYQVKIPEGYKVENIPESKVFKTKKNKAQYLYSMKQVGNNIVLTSIFAINKPIFNEKEYHELKAFYDDVIKKQSEQIVFKKKELSNL